MAYHCKGVANHGGSRGLQTHISNDGGGPDGHIQGGAGAFASKAIVPGC